MDNLIEKAKEMTTFLGDRNLPTGLNLLELSEKVTPKELLKLSSGYAASSLGAILPTFIAEETSK